jgi:mono/diheme cytochrome c family protein
VCHGYAGYGDGLVAQRAEALAATYWLQPTSVHDPRVQQQPIGQIYYTITNGKGKMGGYGSTLNVRERWAVALYAKALQRSQNAQSSDVPLDRLSQ